MEELLQGGGSMLRKWSDLFREREELTSWLLGMAGESLDLDLLKMIKEVEILNAKEFYHSDS